MGERPADDTTKGPAGARRDGGRVPGDYYYDDGTGYEVYDPSEEEPDDEPEDATRVEKP